MKNYNWHEKRTRIGLVTKVYWTITPLYCPVTSFFWPVAHTYRPITPV